ncbi:hypothetical protein L7F22_012571 [Adiantum nelumboides]|nr:hypothetical protein [Adiantum nelumboides]
MASHSQQFQASKRLKVTFSQPQLGSSLGGHSGTLVSSQQFPTPRSPILQATRLFRSPLGSSRWELLAVEQFPREPLTELTRRHHQKEQTNNSIEATRTGKAITLQSSKERNIWDFEINGVNPVSTRALMIDAIQTRGLTFRRAYTKVMESFFGSEKTSSSDYMEEEGEEEKDSSSSSDEENKDPRVAIKQTPLDFEQFLSQCRLERRKRQQPQSFEITPDLSLHVSNNVDESPSHWCVHEGRVEEMSSSVTPQSYTLAIADAPYGFCVPNSVNDDVKYGVSAYKKVIEAFGKVTTCDSWSLVFFHAHDQITAAQKSFHRLKDDMSNANMVKVYKKFKHTGADVQGFINPYQKPQLLMTNLIDLLSMRGEWIMDLFAGTCITTVSALKRGRNVIAVECDPLQVKFIEQRVTALKELPNEFQEVGMKSMAYDPHFFDAFGEPQPPIGSEKVGKIVDLVDFEPDNVEVEEQTNDTPLQITSMGEETRNEEEEDLPIQA